MFGSLFRTKQKNEQNNSNPSLRKLGEQGEALAMEFLSKKGLHLIDRNFYSHFGEIDLIMQDNNRTNDNYLVFIEVRRRKNLGYGSALESIDIRKQQKIRKTAEFFLLKNSQYQNQAVRFDVILVSSDKQKDSIEWIENAF